MARRGPHSRRRGMRGGPGGHALRWSATMPALGLIGAMLGALLR